MSESKKKRQKRRLPFPSGIKGYYCLDYYKNRNVRVVLYLEFVLRAMAGAVNCTEPLQGLELDEYVKKLFPWDEEIQERFIAEDPLSARLIRRMLRPCGGEEIDTL